MISPTASSGAQAVTSGIESAEEPRVFLREGFLWDAEPAYLFDIDGTLLRSQDRIHVTAFFSSVKSVMGRDLNLDPVVLSGNTDPGILHDAFRAAELEDSEWHPVLEDILEAMRSDVLSQRETMQVRVMPGVEATLEHLQAKGAALGVATGNLESIGWLKIEIAGLREWFTLRRIQRPVYRSLRNDRPRSGFGARDCGCGCVSLRSGRHTVRHLRGQGQ